MFRYTYLVRDICKSSLLLIFSGSTFYDAIITGVLSYRDVA